MVAAFILFLLAGLGEIGGGYLVWLWLREGKPLWVGLLGGISLFLYGMIVTFQQFPDFGRVYAAYGGLFIILALLWGWVVENKAPDYYDLLGGTICVIGACIILFAPRG